MILRFGNGDSSIVPEFLGDQTPFKGREFSSAEILEGIVGLQSRFGETTYVVDNLLDGIGGILSDEPTSELAGQRIGFFHRPKTVFFAILLVTDDPAFDQFHILEQPQRPVDGR